MPAVTVVPHDGRWKTEFEKEAGDLATAFESNLIAIHHIGSTSILGIYAKPVIDILVEVHDIEAVDLSNKRMKALGYEAMGEFGIEGRRYFRKDNERGLRTHQVHVFGTGSDHIRRHLAFRDHMIANPADARAYSDLKRQLADLHPEIPEDYMDGKDAFIKDIDRRADRCGA